MKNLIACLLATLLIAGCKNIPVNGTPTVSDGFYQVMKLVPDSVSVSIPQHQVLIPFDTLFNSGDYTRVLIDTAEYIPLELNEAPTTEPLDENRKLLSVTLTPRTSHSMRDFTAKRIMKEVVIVMDGKAITMHKVRDTITGDKMQITRCTDNACEYLYVKMKTKIRR